MQAQTQTQINFDYTPDDLSRIREIFTTLNKGIKASRMYPASHPVPQEYKNMFFERLQSFLERGKPIKITANYESLTIDEEIVFAAIDEQENIASFLHRDGIRRLEFIPGLTVTESSNFFDAFINCNRTASQYDNVANHFWEAGFENIKYEEVDFFEVSEVIDANADIKNEIYREDKESIDIGEIELPIDSDESEDEQAVAMQTEVEQFVESMGEFSDLEILKIEQIVTECRRLNFKEQTIELLLQICCAKETSNELSGTISAIYAVFDRALESSDFRSLRAIVKATRIALEEERLSDFQRQRLRGIIHRASDQIRLAELAKVLNKNPEFDQEPVREFLVDLGADIVNLLVWMLGELEHYPARRLVCDILVDLGLERIDLIGGAVYDSRWFLVRNVVWILGEIHAPQALGFLEKAVTHSDERVRIETVRALAKIGGEQAIDLLLKLIDDDSDQVRSMAIQKLGDCRSLRVFEALEKRINGPDFEKLSRKQIRLIIEAIITCDENRAYDIISALLKKRRIFKRQRLVRLQEQAIKALQKAKDRNTIAILDYWSTRTHDHRSAAAQQVLARLKDKEKQVPYERF